MSPFNGERGHTGFSADPIGVGVSIPILELTISFEPMDGIHQTCMDIPLGQAVELIRFW